MSRGLQKGVLCPICEGKNASELTEDEARSLCSVHRDSFSFVGNGRNTRFVTGYHYRGVG